VGNVAAAHKRFLQELVRLEADRKPRMKEDSHG
jgi:hypothetical protein